jgi:hypothetical protein
MVNESMQKTRLVPPRERKPMLLNVAAVALVLVALGVLAACSSGAGGGGGSAAGGPNLAVDPEKIDFGQVKVDNVVKADFKLRNTGSQPLQIIGEPAVRVVQGC